MHRDGPLGMLFHEVHKKNTDFLYLRAKGLFIWLWKIRNKYIFL